MNNRFYKSRDPANPWPGRIYIGPAKTDMERDRKRISYFAFDGPEGSPIAKLKSAYVNGLAIVDGLRRKREETEATRRFTPLGVTEALGEVALTDSLPALRRAWTAVEKVKADIAAKASSLTLAKPSDEQRKEQEEIRSAMRAMTPAGRDEFLKQNRQNPVVASAIAGAIPALSGLHHSAHQNIVAEQLEREHGETIAELRDLEEVVRVAEKVTTLARDELRETIGCGREIFEQIAKVAEANNGELPFRVETITINGQDQEICRVYDMNARIWRDASADEIQRAA
ncbi:hypothetical protein [Bradyrhizobium sp. AUGA SZCCT0182]|uniref:hypothetical protein n=1 Tax=Bradyrhizobium sp. AUGA SZCCT0182 TaxID=2807667 RepID=UPI001BAA5806|nr:hypothetical protein [Bradyrhizobium sp. AUGA SZCCT0182]MBR1233654.1 hypothetical protein [Bradyrhizobium sp. AUGA SZCCT0182]